MDRSAHPRIVAKTEKIDALKTHRKNLMNFQTAIQRAMESCEASGYAISDQFRGVTKLIIHGKGSLRDVNDEATQ